MSDRDNPGHPQHGEVGYLQLPTHNIAVSVAFYSTVFGWSAETEHGSFTAPGVIGQFTTERKPAQTEGPLLWLAADNLYPTLEQVRTQGGRVHGRPQLDQGERWLIEIDDPSGNRLGIFVAVRAAQPQTMIAVRDVEASSRWYQHLLGLQSDHGGPDYERLLADGVLVLQLHNRELEHHHGRIGDAERDVGNGVLLWFGDVSDFDDVVIRAQELGAPVVRAPHRNPPEGHGSGPGHRELWIQDPDGYGVVIASPDGEAFEP
jgi:predicted enzyme related to lactoylglutathione lyase